MEKYSCNYTSETSKNITNGFLDLDLVTFDTSGDFFVHGVSGSTPIAPNSTRGLKSLILTRSGRERCQSTHL